MRSLEDVIMALEICCRPDIHRVCKDCSYPDEPGCFNRLMSDALHHLKEYRSDRIQWEADRKHWNDELAVKMAKLEDAAQKHVKALKALKPNRAAAPWNPDRNRYCCELCGYYVGKYDRFCPGCGAQLTDWAPEGRGTRK